MTKTAVPLVRRLLEFPQKSWQQKFSTVAARWSRWLPGIPLPWRLPVGVWWLAEFDFLDNALRFRGFEDIEYKFAQLFLKPGMTVLDVGAHRGFYTLLFSKMIGPQGRVLAFEPSPRERKKLKRHLRLNLCHNVEVLSCALGESEGKAELYVVDGARYEPYVGQEYVAAGEAILAACSPTVALFPHTFDTREWAARLAARASRSRRNKLHREAPSRATRDGFSLFGAW